jgi:hypothetical protein
MESYCELFLEATLNPKHKTLTHSKTAQRKALSIASCPKITMVVFINLFVLYCCY